jgi:hypothetical protein
MKFLLEIPDEQIEEANGTLEKYDLDKDDPTDVLKTIILLWFDGEGMLIRDDWSILEDRIKVTLV